MAFYNPNCVIPKEDILKNVKQFQLTAKTSFKLLETGIEGSSECFTARITRYVEYEDGKPWVLYVDMSKAEFDQIVSLEDKIKYLLRHGINQTVFQNYRMHVWTVRPPADAPHRKPMICFCDKNDGTKIFIIERTFNRLMSLVQDVDLQFERSLNGNADSDDDCSCVCHVHQCSDDSDDSDDSYYYQ